jgi:ankyrin repeat protein
VVKLFLDRGAEIEAKTPDSKTALLYAVEYGHEAVELLLEAGANTNIRECGKALQVQYTMAWRR